MAGEDEIKMFVDALDDVMTDAHEGRGLVVEVGKTVARSALRR